MFSRFLSCMVLGVVLGAAWPAQSHGADDPPSPDDPMIMEGPQADDLEPIEEPERQGRRGFGKRHGRPTYERLPEALRAQFDAFIEKYFPEQFEELYRLDEESQDAFHRKVNRMLPPMLRLMRLEEDDPETFTLRVKEVRVSMQIRALARRVPGGNEPARDQALTDRLREHLEQRFELRQKIHRIEIQRLERRLAEAKERIDRQEAEKAQVIDEQLKDILAVPADSRERHRGRGGRRPADER